MSTFEETVVLLFLSLVSIWLFLRPGQVRDRILLMVGAIVTVIIGWTLAWFLAPWSESRKKALADLVMHAVLTVVASALVAISLRLLKKRPPSAPDQPIH